MQEFIDHSSLEVKSVRRRIAGDRRWVFQSNRATTDTISCICQYCSRNWSAQSINWVAEVPIELGTHETFC